LEISAEGPEANDQGSKDQGGQGPGTKNQNPKISPPYPAKSIQNQKANNQHKQIIPNPKKNHPNLKVLTPVQQFQP